jgi:flagellar assembly factor FliW
VKVTTARFGDLDVPEDALITFPEGIPGFSGRRFVLFRRDETPVVEWLQSVEEPDVALMTVDPTELVAGYPPAFRLADLRAIEPEGLEDGELGCRVVIRVATETGKLYLNLFAPLFFNPRRRLGMQLPLVGSRFGIREPWPPEAPAASPTEEAR